MRPEIAIFFFVAFAQTTHGLLYKLHEMVERPKIHGRSTGNNLQQYSEIANDPAFQSLETCARDCLYKTCGTNYTCEGTKHSVDFELGCISASCICDADANKAAAKDIVKKCSLEFCNANQTIASAALGELGDFCGWTSINTITTSTSFNPATSKSVQKVGISAWVADERSYSK
jgi:hypothetical protein